MRATYREPGEKYTSFVRTGLGPSLGKQTHWRPFALKKCAATAFCICVLTLCVFFGFKYLPNAFLPSRVYSPFAGKNLRIKAVMFEALFQVGLFENQCKSSYGHLRRKATFQRTGSGYVEIDTTPTVKVRTVAVS